MKSQLKNIDDIKMYIYGGKAELTLQSSATQKHFTYLIKKSKNSELFFVSVLTGESTYTYLGCLVKDKFNTTKKSKITENAQSYLAFQFFYTNLMNKNTKNLDKLIIFHSGRCSKCGKTLTTPESIKRGVGPYCAKLLHKQFNS